MFWADRIVEEIVKTRKPKAGEGKPFVIRDEKTASGRVHVGSMRGAAIHGSIARVLTEKGVANQFFWETNDFDPFDGLPVYLDRATYEPYMGAQLYTIPAPDHSSANFAEQYGKEFESVIVGAGFHPTFYRASELYLSGKMDTPIKLILEGADTVRRIYKDVSGSVRPEGWLPLSVVCENCGKVSTTRATDFDGETVAYVCAEDAVEWARGCGHRARVSPFKGKAKLQWKPEWAAKWMALGVDIEGGGKDHSTKGGARDVANHIAREVLHIETPFDVPYEFFLVGGKKMSSSKGQGSSAKEVADLLPTKIFRLALLSKDINQAFNFDAEGETIPTLFDLYDRIATSYASGTRDDFTRLFELVEPEGTSGNKSDAAIPVPFLMRFSQVAFVIQMPHLDLFAAAEELKGSPLSDLDRKELEERGMYAKRWLAAGAPEKYRFTLSPALPEAAKELSDLQKKALARILELLEAAQNAEDLHTAVHALKDELTIAPGDLFSAVYVSFFGKKEGPKAGWLLFNLDRTFALNRLKEASGQ